MTRTIKKLRNKTVRMVAKHRMTRKGHLTLARDKIRRKRMSCFILTLAFLLLIIPSYIVLQHRFNSLLRTQEVTEQKQELNTTGAIIYRHLNAYPAYCRKVGYNMVHYSKVFTAENEVDLQRFDRAAQRVGLRPDVVINQIQQDFSDIIQKSIKKEFKRLRERGITSSNAQLIKTDEEICRYMDENASLWLKTEKKSDMEKIHTFAIKY